MSLTMPFGKHKNEPVHTLPKKYLTWLKDNVKLYDPLLTAVEHAIDGKGEYVPTTQSAEERIDEIVAGFIPSDANELN